MLLRLAAEDVHLVVVEALVAAELQLIVAILEVNESQGLARGVAPVTQFGLLEGRMTHLNEAALTAQRHPLTRLLRL